MQYRMK